MDYINWSRIKSWRRCARQYDYKYVQNLMHKRPKLPLFRGSILHEMLDAWVKSAKPAAAKNVLDKYAHEYRTLFREEQEEFGDVIGDCEKIFNGYVRRWSGSGLTFLESEVQLEVELIPGLPYVATIDKIAATSDGQRWLVDHKTHKRIPDEDVRLSDLQLVKYVWAWNASHDDLAQKVNGILWDYLRTKPPTEPEPLKNGELTRRKDLDTDVLTYRNAIDRNGLNPGDYAEVLERLARRTNAFYKRVFLPIPSTTLTMKVVEDARQTARMIRAMEGVYKVRSLDRTCNQCEFYNLCYADLRGLDVEFVRKAEYTDRPQEKYDATETVEEE